MDGLLLQTCSAHGTRRVGVALGHVLLGGGVVALCGNVGAGKATLVQGIAVGLGLEVRVTSPTFTLINEYGALGNRCRLLHADTYRLAEPATEAEMLGELFDEGPGAVVAVEWAERVAALMRLSMEFSPDKTTMDAATDKWTAYLMKFKITREDAKQIIRNTVMVGADLEPRDAMDVYTKESLRQRTAYDLFCAMLRCSRGHYHTLRDLLQTIALELLLPAPKSRKRK